MKRVAKSYTLNFGEDSVPHKILAETTFTEVDKKSTRSRESRDTFPTASTSADVRSTRTNSTMPGFSRGDLIPPEIAYYELAKMQMRRMKFAAMNKSDSLTDYTELLGENRLHPLTRRVFSYAHPYNRFAVDNLSFWDHATCTFTETYLYIILLLHVLVFIWILVEPDLIKRIYKTGQ